SSTTASGIGRPAPIPVSSRTWCSAARANRVSSATASCASAGGTAGPPPTNTAAVDAAMSQSTNAGPADSPRVVGSLTASTLPAYEQPQARRAAATSSNAGRASNGLVPDDINANTSTEPSSVSTVPAS